MRKDSRVRRSKSKYSYPLIQFSLGILYNSYSQWLKLFRGSLPVHVYLDDHIQTSQSKLKKNFNKKIKVSQQYSRVAQCVFTFIKAKKDFLIRLTEGVACTFIETKVHIGLTFQLTSNNFTCLK